MPFTEENKSLLEAAAAIEFKLKKNGAINPFYHNSYERGLFFIQKAVEVHGNNYGYSKVVYIRSRDKVTITCRHHGDFEQIPRAHLDGQACPKCSGKYSPTTEEFIEKARNIHGDKYDYSSVHYKSNHENIEIVCRLHGSFFQTPNNHVSFNGCPKCAGKNQDILYLLKCNETGWYKIGITTGEVQKRIASIGGNIETVHYVKLEDPRKHESILHKKYEKDREYNLCVRDGRTEFFSLTEEQVQEVIAYMNEVSSNA